MDDGCAQATVHRRRRPEANGWVKVVNTGARLRRVEIGNAGLHANAIADAEVSDVFTCREHHAGGFMAEHHRGVNHERANAAMLVIVHITAADAHGMNFYLHIIRAQRFGKLDVLDSDFPALANTNAFILPPGESFLW